LQGNGSGSFLPPAGDPDLIKKAAEEKFDRADPGVKTTFDTDPVDVDVSQESKIVEVRQGRRKVMQLKWGVTPPGTGAGASDLKSDQVQTMDDFFATERQFIQYVVCTDENDFNAKVAAEKQKQTGQNTQDVFCSAAFRTSRVLILWNNDTRQVVRYVLDGEELDPEKELGDFETGSDTSRMA
jgi:hypothetical protein